MVKKHGQSRVRKITGHAATISAARSNGWQIDIDAAGKDVDHMIGAEERFQFAMTR
jgi:hypothetical protein